MNIELHEYLVRLKDNNFVRIRKVIDGQTKELIEGNVGEIEDLLGFHHNKVSNVTLTMTNTLIIDLENEEDDDLIVDYKFLLEEVLKISDGCLVCNNGILEKGGYVYCLVNDDVHIDGNCVNKNKFSVNIEKLKKEYDLKDTTHD